MIDNGTPQPQHEGGKQLTLATLLQALDDMLTSPGQIVIMTTNHRSVLDEASIRPGRVDVDIELGMCDRDMVFRLWKNF